MPAEYVIHTVGPVWHGGNHGEAGLLRSCYQQSLSLAADRHHENLAFSAISCGVYAYPIAAAAEIALTAIADFLQQSEFPRTVYCVCFNPTVYRAYQMVYAQLA